MLSLLACLPLVLPQDEPIPPTPYDRVIELEITADDEPLIEGKGPTVVVEYEVEFRGTVHVWTRAGMDLCLVVEDISKGIVMGQDSDSGGAGAPYVELGVENGDLLAVLVAAESREGLGELELVVVGSPESDQTLQAAREGRRRFLEARRLHEQGKWEDARKVSREAMAFLMKADGATHSEAIVDLLWGLGFLADESLADESSACLAWGEVLRHRARTLPPTHPDLLAARGNLANAMVEIGQHDQAVPLVEAIHVLSQEVYPEGHFNLLVSQMNLAAVLRESGDLRRALFLLEEVCAARESALSRGAPEPFFFAAEVNLAGTRALIGDPVGANVVYERLHDAWVGRLPAQDPNLMRLRHGLASSLMELEDYVRARELYEELLLAMRERWPEDHPEILRIKGGLATISFELGDMEEALELTEEVVATWERLLPPGHQRLLEMQGNLALIRNNLGDVKGALALEELVHEGKERVLPVGSPSLLVTKQNLALRRRDVGDLAGASKMLSSLLEQQLGHLTDLETESPRVARRMALQEIQRYSHALLLGESVPERERLRMEGRLFSVAEGLRLVSTRSRNLSVAASLHPALAALRQGVVRVRQELSDLSLSTPRDGTQEAMDDWQTRLFDLAFERDRLQGRMKALVPDSLRSPMPSLESVGDGLQTNEVWISFLRYWRYFHQDPETRASAPALDSLLAFVVTPDSRVRRVELGAIRELEDLIAAWRAGHGVALTRRASPSNEGERSRGVGAEVAEKAAPDEEVGAQLTRRLIEPCLASIEGPAPRVLRIVLDDLLHLLPVEALPWKESGILGEAYEIRIEASTRRLIAPLPKAEAEGVLLAVGGVDYGASTADPAVALPWATAAPPVQAAGERSGELAAFSALLQTMPEVDAVTSLYEQYAPREPVVLVRHEATKAALHRWASKARFLHVATHGWFAPEAFMSMIDSAVAGARRERFMDLDQKLRGIAPETLCGLALAGANHGADEQGRVPGIITAEELASLDLSNCELAVLSACETNGTLGIRRAGQGIQSLQAALHAAGARTAITSLWRVDDAATRRLMELFYTKLWKDGLGKADALWQAKMALRDEGHGVGDWAGWVLTGDPD